MTRAAEIRRLIDRLVEPGHDPARSFSLDALRHVKGWRVQRSYDDPARNLWSLWTPTCRSRDVPWALPPAERNLTRAELVEVLRELWVPEALRLLAELEDDPG